MFLSRQIFSENPMGGGGNMVRYIRDWATGTNVDAGKYWVEIQVIDSSGVNRALGITPTSSIPPSSYGNGISVITDGSLTFRNGSGYCAIYNGAYNAEFIQIDLGNIYNIQKITVYHYFDGSYKNHIGTKTEVSADGVNWITVFDSAVSGTYTETQQGHTILLN